ncbi:MAG: hypothetical protein OEY34_06395 [Cyclobacteriaceae bacterium]|nr:hypothetical protein [Cyclobacteriaceae bacterium]
MSLGKFDYSVIPEPRGWVRWVDQESRRAREKHILSIYLSEQDVKNE